MIWLMSYPSAIKSRWALGCTRRLARCAWRVDKSAGRFVDNAVR